MLYYNAFMYILSIYVASFNISKLLGRVFRVYDSTKRCGDFQVQGKTNRDFQ
jgi:hypothetical protein